ncbi:MAG: LamG domain-containing protein [Kofleriaceae bacterium]
MRWAGLVVLVGCRQVFGIGDPGPTRGDAGLIDARSDANFDAVPLIGLCNPADSMLVGCWDFDGTVTDSGPHHLDISPAGQVVYSAGRIGQAVFSQPVDLDVAASPLFDVNAVTIEAWVYVIQMPTGNVRAAILDNNNEYAMYVEPSGTLRCYAGLATADATNVVHADTWMHLACTGEGSTLRAYVDGAQVATGVMPAIPTGGTTGLTLGSDNPSGNGSRLDGLLDAVRLYSRALSAHEICHAYDPSC